MSRWFELPMVAGWLSLSVNVALLALNLAMAAFSGSLALLAETAHNLLDLLASLSVLVGLTLSERKAHAFPYGLYKVENVVSVLIAFGTLFTGYEIARTALFAAPRTPDVHPFILVGVLAATAIPVAFSQYELRLGRRVNSPSLIADATEFRAHVLSSGVVFAALVGQLLGLPLDRLAAVAIVLWIVYAGWNMLKDAMRVLLDASLDAATLELARRLITALPEVAEVKSLMGRNSGRYRFIEAEIALRVSDLDRAHRLATEIEDKIRAEIPFVERVLIHIEPSPREVVRVVAPLASDEAVLAAGLGTADRFALCDVRASDGQIVGQQILPNPYASATKGRGLKIAEWLRGQGVDILLTPDPPNPSGLTYALQARGVHVEQAASRHLIEAVLAAVSKERA